MKRKLLWLTVLALLVLPFLLAHAQQLVDDQGNPNDPRVNPRANACYAGAAMGGKCVDEADWIAGWYFIRFQYGIFTADQIPQADQWVLPPVGEVAPVVEKPTATPTRQL